MRSFISRFLSIWVVVALLLSNLPFMPATPSVQAAPQPMQRILLVVNGSYSANPFGAYLGEILRAEGLNAFDVVQLSALTAGDLSSHAVTILAETTLTSGQATLFNNHVNGGGRLIAMRPDAQIKALFGLGTAAGTLADGYLKFESHSATAGLTTNFMQIHGTTDRHSLLAGATMLARLYSNKTTSTVYPAVSLSANGRAAAFTYDLARNVVYTRQGNPANANLDTDGDNIVRTVDLFITGWQGGPWVDRDLIPVPQADEQQRLLARLVQQLQNNPAPLPQLWYFPGTTKTMLILTGDAHANPQSYYDLEINSINSRNGKITLYVTQGGYIATGAGATQANVWVGQGHSIGLHPYGPPEFTNLNNGYNTVNAWFASQFAFPKSRTARNHRVAWEGWTSAAEVAASYGISMDTSFYHWGGWLQKPDNSWPHGHITGSGQPMKFVKSDGTILPIYQQNTQLVDEHILTGVGFGFENLGASGATAVSQAMINASQNGDYAALMTMFHVDYYNFGHPQTWAEATMDYANSSGIPMWNADQWLDFTETRYGANYTNLQWDSATNTLSFSLAANNTAGVNLTTLLPANFNNLALQSVSVDGNATSFTTQAIKGLSTAFVSTSAGNHTISAVYAVSGPTPTPTITNTPTNTHTPTVGPSPTPSLTNTPAPTATFTPSLTPSPVPNALTHTSAADFAQSCATLTNTFVSSIGGGAVTLASALTDNFSGPSLNTSLWTSGLWAGGAYNPMFAGGQITLPNGGYVRSLSTFTRGAFEANASFGNGPWQHLGFASQDFAGDRYFIFSTFNGDGNLHARVNNSAGEQRVSLGPIPTGLHRYRVEWMALNGTTDQHTFFIDGAQVAQMSVASAGAANLHAYLSNNGAANLALDNVLVATPYLTSGTYESCTLDAGAGNVWQTGSWDATTPASTGLSVEVRASADGTAWSGWAAASGGALPNSNRYLQYRLTLTTSDTLTTLAFNAITFNLGAGGPTSTPTNTPVPPTATATNTPVPPTATFTNTPVPPTATATNTPLPPTATPSNTPVPPTATFTNTPTFTPTNTPTSTNTATPTNTPLPDLIFADGFETGNLTAWSSSIINGGNLSANSAAALVGAQGLRVNITSNTAMYVQSESPNAEPRYRARFYFDPNTITMASGNAHNILYAYATNLSTVVTYVEFRNSSGSYQIRGQVITDAGTFTTTTWFTISDAPHAIEFDWRAATAAGANNGAYTLWIDGVQRADLINLDNDTRRIERIRFGPVAGIDTGTRGIYFLDAFESRRYNYIGLAGVTPTATPTNTPLPSTATLTNTPVPPTATFTSTPLPPTATFTSTPVPPTATHTPIPPTATNTSVAPTATFTNTAVPPTATFTNTPIPPTATPTNTPIPPTATFTNTPLPPTPTNTLVPGGPITVTLQINQSAADVNEDGANYSEGDSYLWLGSGSSATASYAGLNFGGVNIPQGATITSARLELASNSSQWIGLNVRLMAENVGNSALFSSGNRPSQRTVTTQEVLHTSDNLWVTDTYYQLNQMASVVQAVISRPDWQSGNRLSILLRGNGNAWARKFFHSFEGNPTLAPRLVIVYTVP